MGLIDYIKDTKGELKHVSWATRDQAIAYTSIVIGVSIVIGLLLGAFDLGFTALLRLVI